MTVVRRWLYGASYGIHSKSVWRPVCLACIHPELIFLYPHWSLENRAVHWPQRHADLLSKAYTVTWIILQSDWCHTILCCGIKSMSLTPNVSRPYFPSEQMLEWKKGVGTRLESMQFISIWSTFTINSICMTLLQALTQLMFTLHHSRASFVCDHMQSCCWMM